MWHTLLITYHDSTYRVNQFNKLQHTKISSSWLFSSKLTVFLSKFRATRYFLHFILIKGHHGHVHINVQGQINLPVQTETGHCNIIVTNVWKFVLTDNLSIPGYLSCCMQLLPILNIKIMRTHFAFVVDLYISFQSIRFTFRHNFVLWIFSTSSKWLLSYFVWNSVFPVNYKYSQVPKSNTFRHCDDTNPHSNFTS